jgi:ATP-dependent protease ClpP protease subunit
MSSEEKNKDSEAVETAPERPDGSVNTKSKGGISIRTITVSGQIEGHNLLPTGTKATKYELLIPQIVEIEEDPDTDCLLLILNTVGGDVEAGLALSELIAGMKKPTASIVLGGGHSIGVPLAVSTKRSFIVRSATMTIHPVRVSGLVLGAPQTFVFFDRMQDRITDFVCSHSKMTPERFRSLMLSHDEMTTDLGSVLDGERAVSEGLIDSIGSLSDALDYLHSVVNKKASL